MKLNNEWYGYSLLPYPIDSFCLSFPCSGPWKADSNDLLPYQLASCWVPLKGSQAGGSEGSRFSLSLPLCFDISLWHWRCTSVAAPSILCSSSPPAFTEFWSTPLPPPFKGAKFQTLDLFDKMIILLSSHCNSLGSSDFHYLMPQHFLFVPLTVQYLRNRCFI